MKTLLSLLLVATGVCGRPLAAEPADPQANPKTRAVLDFFHGLSARQEKRVLSGQFTNFGRGAGLRLLQEIRDKTGHWPALMGVDYADFGKGGLTYKEPNQAALEYAKQGGLITVSAHLYNPANTKGGGLRDKGVDLATLLAPGTETHTRWLQELDILAAGLQELADAGIVVLWRPFHEMNGGWFWWGDKDPDTFIKVWRHMFDYFTQTKGLHNLLWVYGPNHGANTAKYYPGDRYVDIVGLDAYTDFIDPEHIKGYPEVAALPKPFGFTEYGPHGSQNPPGDYDYRRFMAGLEKHFPKACFFMSWNAKWSLAQNLYAQELLSHPWVANREDLPPNLTMAQPLASSENHPARALVQEGQQVAQRNACWNNLRQIDGAKQQWALENKKSPDTIPIPQDIAPYLKNGVLPNCPGGGTYTLNSISADPRCSVPGHALLH